jgi:hypothetical protein
MENIQNAQTTLQQHADIIPLDDRTDGFRILSNLRSIPEWDEQWKTLTVTKFKRGIAVGIILPSMLNEGFSLIMCLSASPTPSPFSIDQPPNGMFPIRSEV